MKVSDFVTVEKIEKGWSHEQKYKVTDKSGQSFLLRITPMEQYEQKKVEFENMKRVSRLGIPMCQPIELGTCDEGVYSLQSWIDGRDLRDIALELTEEELYRYGLDAGKILKKMHSIKAPEGMEDWESFFNRKMDRKIEMYRNCALKYDGGEAFITYIEQNRHLLKSRPMTYQHGDYHTGNLMIDTEGNLVVIDFNRDDYGDPWEEFNRIVWCVQEAPPFACGMVDGYFDGEVPMEFWTLLALYISSNTLSSLPWAIPFGQGEIDVMTKQAAEILDWYDGMTNVVPKWYQPQE